MPECNLLSFAVGRTNSLSFQLKEVFEEVIAANSKYKYVVERDEETDEDVPVVSKVRNTEALRVLVLSTLMLVKPDAKLQETDKDYQLFSTLLVTSV